MMSEEARTKIVLLTGHYRIVGYIGLLPGARVTDFLSESREFIAVTDAEVWDLSGRRLFSSGFMDINRNKIELIMPVGVVTHGLGTAGL
jgi:hypothetical protein